MTLHPAVASGSRGDFGPLLVGLRDADRFRLSTSVCSVAGPDEAERQTATHTGARFHAGA